MRRYLIVVFCWMPLFVLAQQEMEIIPLRYKTLDQLLPALQAIVETGGALSGMNNQLIIRASRKNIEQIRQALTALDTPVRNLMISVSQNRAENRGQKELELSSDLRLGSNVRVIQPSNSSQSGARIEVRQSGSHVSVQAGEAYSQQNLHLIQQVRVLEGGQALIRSGQYLPFPVRQVVRSPSGAVLSDSFVYRDLAEGFYATPRLSGARVTIDIRTQLDKQSQQGYGNVSVQSLSSSVSGRLGEWIELGSIARKEVQDSSTVMRGVSGEIQDSRSVWLLVEEIP